MYVGPGWASPRAVHTGVLKRPLCAHLRLQAGHQEGKILLCRTVRAIFRVTWDNFAVSLPVVVPSALGCRSHVHICVHAHTCTHTPAVGKHDLAQVLVHRGASGGSGRHPGSVAGLRAPGEESRPVSTS